MEMQGERLVWAPKQAAWDALFDPDVLRQCIPGCESVERLSDTNFKATIILAVGPVKAKFTGDATMSNINAPDSCKLTGKGNGGIAGFGKGEASIQLAERGSDTLLTYQVKATVGGKLAQVGQRLIDSTSQKLADDFFSAFVKVLESRSTSAPAADAVSAVQTVMTVAPPRRPIIWVPIAVGSGALLAAALYFVFA